MSNKLPKVKRRRLPIFSILIFIICIALAIFLAMEFGLLRENCKSDIYCFEDAAMNCKPANYLTLKNLNYYKYTIYGTKKGDCEVKIALKKMAVGTPEDRRDLLEGKEMTCLLPQNRWDELAAGEVEGLLRYCDGSLKEGMYELIIKKLYSVVIVNLGDVVGSIEDQLKSERI